MVIEIDLNSDGSATSLLQAYSLSPEGLVMEFGVATGRSINSLADQNPNRIIYGFDSFDGLPEAWNGMGVGHFKCEVPKVRHNVILVKGLFEDTLPKFMEDNEGDIGFIHIDCDLYSSTKTIFNNVKNRLAKNAIISFDELIDYGKNEEWRQHEYKAFQEFLLETNYNYKCIARWSRHQASFKLWR